jgi:hypothetical protein
VRASEKKECKPPSAVIVIPVIEVSLQCREFSARVNLTFIFVQIESPFAFPPLVHSVEHGLNIRNHKTGWRRRFLSFQTNPKPGLKWLVNQDVLRYEVAPEGFVSDQPPPLAIEPCFCEQLSQPVKVPSPPSRFSEVPEQVYTFILFKTLPYPL